MKNNCYCAICGKGYYVCLPCSKPELKTWKLHTCTSEHYKIYSVIHGFSTGVYTKEETYNRLKNVNLSDKSCFKDNIQKIIDNILSEYEIEKPIKKVSRAKKTEK